MKEALRGEGGSDVFSSTRHVNPNAVSCNLNHYFNLQVCLSVRPRVERCLGGIQLTFWSLLEDQGLYYIINNFSDIAFVLVL